MKNISQTCVVTRKPFDLSVQEQEAYEQFGLPLPRLHPTERLRNKLLFVNEQHFFWRECAVTQERIFSLYPQSVPFPVVSPQVWPTVRAHNHFFGREFLPERSFFEQLFQLWCEVPRNSVSVANSEEADTVLVGQHAKNSLLVTNAYYCDHCFYSVNIIESLSCADCLLCSGLEYCYECIDCHDSKRLSWGEGCIGCLDCKFLVDCVNCTNCLFCVGLEGAHYHVFNEPVSEEEYHLTIRRLSLQLRPMLANAKERFFEFLKERGVAHVVPGSDTDLRNGLIRVRNAIGSADCRDSFNLINCQRLFRANGCLEGFAFGDGLEESAQFVHVGGGASRVINSMDCWDDVSNLLYCISCERSSNLLGCIGLFEREFCILNQQYSESDFMNIAQAIEDQMQHHGNWGYFFPVGFTPFPYNVSAANDYMPLSEVQASLLGYLWAGDLEILKPSEILRSDSKTANRIVNEVPASIAEVEEEMIGQVIICEMSGKPFRWSRGELELYRELDVPPPDRAYEQRHRERITRLQRRRAR